MKKEYCKPDVVFENFELTSSIAADCVLPSGVNAHFGNPSSCAYTDNGWAIFTSSTSGCMFLTQPDQEDYLTYGYCYHVSVSSDAVAAMYNS